MNEDALFNIIGRMSVDLFALQARVRQLERELATAKVVPPAAPDAESK